MRRSGKYAAAARGLLLAAAAALAVIFTATSVGNVGRSADTQGRQRLEDSIRRSAVACYAAEGVYPPTVAYLEEHYGLQVDAERYTVYYDVFADNLMPDITVLENED